MDGWETGLVAVAGSVIGSVIGTTGTLIVDRKRRQHETTSRRAIEERETLTQLHTIWSEILTLALRVDENRRSVGLRDMGAPTQLFRIVTQATIVADRVRDAEIRRLVVEAAPHITAVGQDMYDTKTELRTAMVLAWDKANNRIATVIREL